MPDAPDRLTQALQDRYRIERELGAGGMATVYLAQDLRHDRQVALKVLRPELAAVLGAERFVVEIKTTASLQHPHILPLFDSGAADGFLYYVMPFIDGETLRAKLDRETQLGVADAVRIAREVADALEYAHQHGIVHRDIKPENILLHGGHAMVADFGIALAVSAAAGGRMTDTGLLLGTPHYMSPEQATGAKDISARSDVYSLGSVLYEMLAGEPPHTGGSSQQMIMKIIADPVQPVTQLRKSVPPNVAAAVAKALEKLPADRFASAHAFAAALADPHFAVGAEIPGAGLTAHAQASRSLRSILLHPVVLGLGVLLLAAVVVNATLLRRLATTLPQPPTIRFSFTGPDSARAVRGSGAWPVAISPDGSLLVYQALEAPGSSRFMLHLRRSDRLDAPAIPGTTGGTQPLFSPDGQWLAFIADNTLKKVRLDGGAPVTIAEGGGSNNGADWTTTNELVVGATGVFHGLSHVPTAGGELAPLTRPDSTKGEDHFWPIALPDGHHVVFAIWTGALATSQLAMTSLDDGRVAPLGLKGIRPLAVLDGALVYHQADGLVMAVPLDVAGRKIGGTPVPVHDPVPLAATSGGEAAVFLSPGGALVSALPSTAAQLMWVARDGSRRPMGPDRRDFSWPRLSPDQKRMAVLVGDGARHDVWIQDLASGTLSRLTTTANVTSVAWKTDGAGVVFSDNTGTVWSQSVDRATTPTALVHSLNLVQAVDLSPDGHSLLVQAWSENRFRVLRIALDSGPAVRPFTTSPAWDETPGFSPDGHWVALMSDESGASEVYVRSFPDPTVKLQISAGGGTNPVWSADGTRLYYKAGAALVAARLATVPSLRVVSRDTILTAAAQLPAQFDITRDGQRIVAPFRISTAFQLVVVPNWLTEFRQRMAASKR